MDLQSGESERRERGALDALLERALLLVSKFPIKAKSSNSAQSSAV